MPSCKQCGTMILWGGVRDDGDRYCNAKCHDAGIVKRMAKAVPDDLIDSTTAEVHAGDCPQCRRPGPVDVHAVHTVYSFLIACKFQTTSYLCCRSCGMMKQFKGIGSNMLLGWWSTFGLLMTPVQIVRNLGELLIPPSGRKPSKELRKYVRTMIAANAVEFAMNNPLPAEDDTGIQR